MEVKETSCAPLDNRDAAVSFCHNMPVQQTAFKLWAENASHMWRAVGTAVLHTAELKLFATDQWASRAHCSHSDG